MISNRIEAWQRQRLALFVARHRILVPNHHAISVWVGEFRTVAPRNILRFVNEANAAGREFVVLGVNVVALEGQHTIALAVGHRMLNQDELHSTAIFESTKSHFDILELQSKVEIIDVPVARCGVVRDVDG